VPRSDQALLASVRDVETVDVANPGDGFDFWPSSVACPSLAQRLDPSDPYLSPIRSASRPGGAVADERAQGRHRLEGRPDFRRDRYRSPRASRSYAALDVPGVSFVALQKGVDEELAPPAEQRFVPLAHRNPRFRRQRGIVSQLDLVITSDRPWRISPALGNGSGCSSELQPDWRCGRGRALRGIRASCGSSTRVRRQLGKRRHRNARCASGLDQVAGGAQVKPNFSSRAASRRRAPGCGRELLQRLERPRPSGAQGWH